jgi:hypothetical protein
LLLHLRFLLETLRLYTFFCFTPFLLNIFVYTSAFIHLFLLTPLHLLSWTPLYLNLLTAFRTPLVKLSIAETSLSDTFFSCFYTFVDFLPCWGLYTFLHPAFTPLHLLFFAFTLLSSFTLSLLYTSSLAVTSSSLLKFFLLLHSSLHKSSFKLLLVLKPHLAGFLSLLNLSLASTYSCIKPLALHLSLQTFFSASHTHTHTHTYTHTYTHTHTQCTHTHTHTHTHITIIEVVYRNRIDNWALVYEVS